MVAISFCEEKSFRKLFTIYADYKKLSENRAFSKFVYGSI